MVLFFGGLAVMVQREIGFLSSLKIVPLTVPAELVEPQQWLSLEAPPESPQESQVHDQAQDQVQDQVQISTTSRSLQRHVESANKAQQQSAPLSFRDVLGLPSLQDEEEDEATSTTGSSSRVPKNRAEEFAINAKRREKATKIKNERENANRTAIVWVTRYLDDCGAERLLHLLTTAATQTTRQQPPQQRDVWILHNHKSLKRKSPDLVRRSEQLVTQLKEYAQDNKLNITLRGAHQSSSTLNLDGKRSGSGKSSFLRFVAYKRYQFAWHIEDDVFFTGPWHNLFDAFVTRPDDVISTGDPAPSDWYYHVYETCTLRVPVWAEFNQQRMFLPCECASIAPKITRWAILRMSLRFAESLLELSKTNAIVGHHEAVLAPMCDAYHYQCDNKELLQPHNGHICTAGWGPWKNASTQVLELHGNITHNRLYHPVKCAAYEHNLTSLTDQLLYT
ncbi:expressed unknown protein [Seminavis robusta]|uniref:Uncharacterized protein n=1 Tax=Seminavis robusta TaxID=568900 RepID=A0A9N8DRE8_9STRA|nr:expressed unknown protein [Seminavis robusta]|eukprot:Sro201_g084940.1 n/a (449) ;mRNA; f:8498-9844